MARIAKRQETRRLNLELNEAVRSRLEELRDEVGAESLAEVIRRSLALYDHVHTKKKEGFELCLKKEDEVRIL
ncbi:MAG: hypothetical protein KDA66_09700, partial [Planctomycetaceae bacterium]|nr:hypothetical protein [Planctomycetaceae bacterium]